MVEGGYPFYGQNIGVIVFNGKSPRLPGDPGHSLTFNFPVYYEVVDGNFSDLIEGSDEIKEKLIKAIMNMESRGIKAVIGDCGLMALYQKEIASASSIPVLTSSLVMIPWVWSLIGSKGSIGIITGHSGILGSNHLKGAGITNEISLEIQGMEEEPHFKEVVIEGGRYLNMELMRQDVINAAKKLMQKNSNIRAVLMECSNLPTFSKDVYNQFNIPVFDIVSGAMMLEYSINPPKF